MENTFDLTIKTFDLPVALRDDHGNDGEITQVMDYVEVDLNEHLIKEEPVDMEPVRRKDDKEDLGQFIHKLAKEIKEYNKSQLLICKMDSSIKTAYKRVLCKVPKTPQTEN